MCCSEVGDDVYREDPTVVELESRVATLLDKQDALWVPSGTMANMVAILANCSRGDQVIMGSASHVWLWEQHGLSSLGGLAMHPLPNDLSVSSRVSQVRGMKLALVGILSFQACSRWLLASFFHPRPPYTTYIIFSYTLKPPPLSC